MWLDAPYVITARKLFNWAVAANDAGHVFPVRFMRVHLLFSLPPDVCLCLCLSPTCCSPQPFQRYNLLSFACISASKAGVTKKVHCPNAPRTTQSFVPSSFWTHVVGPMLFQSATLASCTLAQIHGTCLGFQLLHILASNVSRNQLLVDTDSVAHATTLEYWGDARNSSAMFGGLQVGLGQRHVRGRKASAVIEARISPSLIESLT